MNDEQHREPEPTDPPIEVRADTQPVLEHGYCPRCSFDLARQLADGKCPRCGERYTQESVRRAARLDALKVTLLFGWPFLITGVAFTVLAASGWQSLSAFVVLLAGLLALFINTIVQCCLQSRHVVSMVLWLILTLLLLPLLPTIACVSMISRGAFWG